MSHDVLTRPTFHWHEFHGLVTVSPQMLAFFERLERVAHTESTVLIRGESGTGKELVARALHADSPRSKGPFRALNCATLTSELLASELFGHVRGAFTGAVRDKPGLFSLADGGTVFLDEVAEIPPDIQARLLRVLQERTFVPVGGTQPTRVDVRVVSATNKALRTEVEQGRFREDLMYRIRVVVLFLPSLVERTGDVEALIWHFVDEFNRQGHRQVTGIGKDAMDALLAYAWPGNVRELRNNVEQAFALGEGPVIALEDLAPEVQGMPVRTRNGPAGGPQTLQDLEREQILEALRRTRGRKGDAAALLGMSRSTLWRKLKTLGLQ